MMSGVLVRWVLVQCPLNHVRVECDRCTAEGKRSDRVKIYDSGRERETVPVQITSGWSILKVNFLVLASLSTTSLEAVILIVAGAADAWATSYLGTVGKAILYGDRNYSLTEGLVTARFKNKNTHLGEGVQNIPVPIVLVKDRHVGSCTRTRESFTDRGRYIIVARRGVSASNKQVVFACRDLINWETCRSAERDTRQKIKGSPHSPYG